MLTHRECSELSHNSIQKSKDTIGPCSDRVENAESSTENRAQDGTASLGFGWEAPLLWAVSLRTLPSDSFLMDWFFYFTDMGRYNLKPRLGGPGPALSWAPNQRDKKSPRNSYPAQHHRAEWHSGPIKLSHSLQFPPDSPKGVTVKYAI